MNDSELHELKTQVDLAAYCIAQGWTRDEDKSTKQVAFLRNESDKIVVKRGDCGYDLWAEVPGYDAKGSIIDFLLREGLSFGEVRGRLRELAGKPDFSSIKSEPKPAKPDDDGYRKKAAAVWNAAHWQVAPRYLLIRRIPPSTLADWRFKDCWRVDGKGNVIFPFWERAGSETWMCGYEYRNEELKKFGAGVKKGVWVSKNLRDCLRLAICESPIDCLSFHALHLDAVDQELPLGYCAFGGGIGNRQRETLRYLMQHVTERGGSIIAAVDNDQAGDEYFGLLSRLAPHVERILPVGSDWNDDLVWCQQEEGESWN
jgi:hypothetical protein